MKRIAVFLLVILSSSIAFGSSRVIKDKDLHGIWEIVKGGKKRSKVRISITYEAGSATQAETYSWAERSINLKSFSSTEEKYTWSLMKDSNIVVINKLEKKNFASLNTFIVYAVSASKNRLVFRYLYEFTINKDGHDQYQNYYRSTGKKSADRSSVLVLKRVK